MPKSSAAAGALYTAAREVRKNLYTPLDSHKGHEVFSLISGNCSLHAGGRHYSIKPGELLFIPGGEYHNTFTNRACEIVYAIFEPHRITAHPGLLEILLKPFAHAAGGGTHRHAASPAMMEAFLTLVEASGSLAGQLEAFAGWIRHFGGLRYGPSSPSRTLARARLMPAIDHIHRHYGEPLRIAALASLCSLSEPSFFRHFRRLLNQTPVRFIQSVRLEEARTLLMTTQRKVSDIAQSAGFQNVSFFNRQFRKYHGKTPTRFRNN